MSKLITTIMKKSSNNFVGINLVMVFTATITKEWNGMEFFQGRLRTVAYRQW